MSTLNQQRHDLSENCITIKLSLRTHKVKIINAKVIHVLKLFNTELEHVCGRDVAYDFEMVLRRRGLHKPEFAYYIIRIHSSMISTYLIDYFLLASQKLPCCLVLRFFKGTSWDVTITQSTRTISHSISYISDHRSKDFIIILNLTWKHDMKKPSLVHSVCFDCFDAQ